MKFKAIGVTLIIACFVGILAEKLCSEPLIFQQFLLAQSPNSQENEVRELLKQGNQAFGTGQLKEALQLWKQGLLLAESLSNSFLKGSLLINLGVFHRELGELGKSFEYFDQAQPIYQNHNNPEEAKLLENLGINYWVLADYDTAFDYFQKTLKIVRETNDLPGQASALSNIALVYTQLNNYDQAIENGSSVYVMQ